MTGKRPPRNRLNLAMMQGVLEHLGHAICVFDGDLRLVVWNRPYAEMFELPERLLRRGTAFEDIVRHNARQGEYGQGFLEAIVERRMELVRNYQAHRTERVRPNGRIIEIIGNPLPGGGFVTSYNDITVARQIQDNLRESNERLDQMVERRTRALQDSRDRLRAHTEMLEATVNHMPHGVALFDADLALVVANTSFFTLGKMPVTYNVPGRPLADFLMVAAVRGDFGTGDPEQLAGERLELACLRQALAMDHLRSDGAVIEFRQNPIPGQGLIVTLADITERHRTEQALRDATAMARTMLNAPGLIIFLVTADGVVIDVNDGGADAFNRTKDALIGDNIYTIMPPEASIRRRTHADKALALGHPVHFEDEYRGRWYEITVAPCPSPPGEPPRLMIFSHDVTHRHEAERNLREATELAQAASRSKSEFLAAMSHELRTPLNAILGFSEIISREMFGPVNDRYRSYGSDINSAGQHLLAMINDILDISRIEIGAFPLNLEEITPRELAEASLRLVSSRADQGEIRLLASVPADLPPFKVDIRRAKQVLVNLLSNAVKFTPQGGTVSLSARVTADGELEFIVADTGIGMSAADVDIALTPFGQVDSGLDRRFEGAGLGLPLAKSLIELHGGGLGLETAPGQGTTVTVRFPRG